MRPCTPPHAAARPRNLPWAPYQLPHAAARPVICHGPLYRPPHAARQVQSVSWVPVRPPIAAVSIRGHTLTCATFRSTSHCWSVSIFVIGCCNGLPIAAASPPHCGVIFHSTLWFWPRELPK
ncbi:unnamed protein product [Staurois parvus]|uniref:Uncharacterized protein n=1 Tax=Staurois parvus TaxID=386267 RepID=A0ABN9CRA7_9NEOB|nr:unnamed protein product [Staurois parvus]